MAVHVQNPVDDAELTRSLVDLMGHLRIPHYAAVVGDLEGALQGSGNAFIDTLARHLLFEEQVLFPEIRRQDPAMAEKVRSLQAEHAELRELATELARAIKSGNREEGYRVARSFLAELYSHIDHEAEVTEQGKA
jgi:hemerythrin-like domain-containing protein